MASLLSPMVSGGRHVTRRYLFSSCFLHTLTHIHIYKYSVSQSTGQREASVKASTVCLWKEWEETDGESQRGSFSVGSVRSFVSYYRAMIPSFSSSSKSDTIPLCPNSVAADGGKCTHAQSGRMKIGSGPGVSDSF